MISIIVPQDPRGQIAQASNDREELRIYTMIWVLEDKTTQKREYTFYQMIDRMWYSVIREECGIDY